jgi:phytoene dehydrogenase-like protein
MSGAEGELAVLEQRGAELHLARRINAVDVAKGGREQVAPSLSGSEDLCHAQQILGSGVELAGGGLSADAVLLAAHDSDLDLEYGVRGRQLGKKQGRETQILLQRKRMDAAWYGA